MGFRFNKCFGFGRKADIIANQMGSDRFYDRFAVMKSQASYASCTTERPSADFERARLIHELNSIAPPELMAFAAWLVSKQREAACNFCANCRANCRARRVSAASARFCWFQEFGRGIVGSMSEPLFAYLHLLFVIMTVGFLVAELVTYRSRMTVEQVRKLAVYDTIYFMGALGILATGFIRALWAGKGWDYYAHHHFFWEKVGFFAVWAMVSIVPTLHFQKLKKEHRTGVPSSNVEIPRKQYAMTRGMIHLQLTFALLLPLFAVLLARGY